MRTAEGRALAALPRRRQVGLPLTRSRVGKHPPGKTSAASAEIKAACARVSRAATAFRLSRKPPVRTGACAIRHCTTVKR